MGTLYRLHDVRRRAKTVFFTRPELNQLLSLYSRQVMRAEWRDYAIDQHEGAAFFSVFRHTQERPLYTVAKFAPGASRHGLYAIVSGPQILAGGGTLSDILNKLQRMLPAARPVDLERYR